MAMKTIIIYHSRTGNNRSSSEAIARALKADPMEIDKNGIPLKRADLSGYSKILFCFPIWAFSPASPVKRFISATSLDGKKAGAVTICGGHPWRSEKTFRKLVEKSGGTFLGFASIRDSGDRAADNRKALQKAREILRHRPSRNTQTG